MNRSRAIACFSLPALLYCLPGHATTVYKSVDDSGVVSFSDTLIEDNVLLEEVQINNEARPGDPSAQQRLEDMRETTDRMAADRMARERHRAEMRELEATSAAMRTPDDDYPDSYDYRPVTTGGYFNYSNWRHYRRPGHVRPEHPIARPPLRPDTRPSLYDNFPAPHIRPLFTPRTRGAPRQ